MSASLGAMFARPFWPYFQRPGAVERCRGATEQRGKAVAEAIAEHLRRTCQGELTARLVVLLRSHHDSTADPAAIEVEAVNLIVAGATLDQDTLMSLIGERSIRAMEGFTPIEDRLIRFFRERGVSLESLVELADALKNRKALGSLQTIERQVRELPGEWERAGTTYIERSLRDFLASVGNGTPTDDAHCMGFSIKELRCVLPAMADQLATWAEGEILNDTTKETNQTTGRARL